MLDHQENQADRVDQDLRVTKGTLSEEAQVHLVRRETEEAEEFQEKMVAQDVQDQRENQEVVDLVDLDLREIVGHQEDQANQEEVSLEQRETEEDLEALVRSLNTY